MIWYSPASEGRHELCVTLSRGGFSGKLYLETGGSERGGSVILSAFDFLDYPGIIKESDCFFEHDESSDTFSVSLFHETLNGRGSEIYLSGLTREELRDMITSVEISMYIPEN